MNTSQASNAITHATSKFTFILIAGLLVLAATLSLTQRTQAKQSCVGPNAQGIVRCTFYIELDQFKAAPPIPQKMSLWCWAASLSMIYTMEGHPISQDEIVRQNFGQLVNAPGGEFLTFEARMNRKYVDANGKTFKSIARRVDTIPQAMTSLRENIPILYTTKSHATVQTGLVVDVSPVDNRVVGGQIWDPQPGFGLRPLTPQDIGSYAGAWYIQTVVE